MNWETLQKNDYLRKRVSGFMQKATKVDELYRVFKGVPLSVEDLQDFYVDATQARGSGNTRLRIARELRRNLGSPMQMLFVGYKGCGKSTELNHLHKDLSNDFLVVNFSVLEELDTNRLSHIELFIVTMERLFDAVDQNGLTPYVSEGYLKTVQAWIQQKEIEEIREKYNISGELEAGAGFDVPFFKAFFAKLKLTAKTSASLKEKIKSNLEPKLTDLIDHCNDLLREVFLALKEIGKKDILIIIEDLDKIPLDQGQNLFYNHIHQLTLLRTNVIFTFPIALYHSIRLNSIKAHFNGGNGLFELPMIKVANKDGSENEEGMNTMRDIVAHRCEMDLFESSEILDQMIRDSGGCLRDLFLMIYEAAEHALDDGQAQLNQTHKVKAFQRLKKEYDNSIAEYREDDEVYPVDDYYNALVNLAKSPTKEPENTEVVMHLRQSLAILGYNGEGWCDVHPVVKQILIDRGKL